MSCRHSVASSAGSGTCDTNNNMLSADNLLRLALKKPKDWKWELTTSSSSPNISFPKIQLFDSTSGELMVEVDRADCVIRSDCSDGRGASKHHATLSVEQSDLLQSSSSSREQDSQRPGRYRRARTSLVKERLSTSGDSLADIFNQLQNKGLGHKLSTSGSQYRLLNGAAEEARGSLQKSKSANAIISPEPELVTRRKSRRSVASRSSSILERISEFYGHSSTDDEELSSDQRLPVVPVPVPQLSLPSGGDPPAKEQWESSGVTIEEIPSTAPIKPRPKIYKLVRSNVGTLMVREESFHTQNSLRRRPPANNERETPETMGPGFERIVQLEDHPDEGPEPPKGRSRYEQEINRIDGLLSRVMLSHDLQTEELKRNTPSIHVSEPPPEDTRHLSTGTNGVTHLSNGTNPRRRRSRRSASVGASVFPGTQNGVRATSSSSNSEETTTRRRKSRSSSQKRRGRSRHRGNTHEDTHATISNGK
ncbi:uncharacterized protein LOC128728537 [Anopheles nili]|uniref:uncharacterized protein LOC128728537 n=1 Tax=Anopheles nili TaxID=185578 RepID=UPI00237AB8F2|nr:uncharacterized protein LOC128728537 [Anopheles nili]